LSAGKGRSIDELPPLTDAELAVLGPRYPAALHPNEEAGNRRFGSITHECCDRRAGVIEMGNPNPRTTYFNTEIGRNYRLERAETCPPEHEHLTPVDALRCAHANKGGSGIVAVSGEFPTGRYLTPEENAAIDQFVKSDLESDIRYFAADIFGRGHGFERVETCPPEHDHLTPVDALRCLRKNKRGGGVLAAAGEFHTVRRLTPEEEAAISQYIESLSPQTVSQP